MLAVVAAGVVVGVLLAAFVWLLSAKLAGDARRSRRFSRRWAPHRWQRGRWCGVAALAALSVLAVAAIVTLRHPEQDDETRWTWRRVFLWPFVQQFAREQLQQQLRQQMQDDVAGGGEEGDSCFCHASCRDAHYCTNHGECSPCEDEDGESVCELWNDSLDGSCAGPCGADASESAADDAGSLLRIGIDMLRQMTAGHCCLAMSICWCLHAMERTAKMTTPSRRQAATRRANPPSRPPSAAVVARVAAALECPICFERYGAAPQFTPRQMACGHTFCECCLAQMLARLPADNGAKLLDCATCREPTELRRGNAKSLPKNLTILQMVDYQ